MAVKGKAVPQEVLDVLGAIELEGQALRIPSQLDRKLYLKTNEVLENIGAKWIRGKKAHIFTAGVNPVEAIENVLLTGSIVMPQDYGYFPTPKPLAEELVVMACLTPGISVLEPSAGQGHLAKVIATKVGADRVHCVELLENNVTALNGNGFKNVVQQDFLTMTPEPKYNAVVMNPPFGAQQDIDHVRHAFRFLTPGGRLVSVMSAAVSFRQNKKTTEFRQFLKENGGYFTANAPDSFKESGTSVNTVRLFLEKTAHAA